MHRMFSGGWWLVLAVLAAFGSLVAGATAVVVAAAPTADERAEIQKASAAYLKAADKRDYAALAKMWTDDGDFIDAAGNEYQVKALLKNSKQPPAAVANRPKLSAGTSSIRVIAPDVAIEDVVSDPAADAKNGTPSGRFSAVWVKREGKWLLASVRESQVESPAAANHLAELQWMVGQWTGDDHDAAISIRGVWGPNRMAILRTITIRERGRVIAEATQRIGWDPLTEKIHSWLFDADGGYGEGVWNRHGNTWVVDTTGVLPNGKKSSGVTVYTLVDNDHFRWSSVAAQVGGDARPDQHLSLQRAVDKEESH